MIRKFMLAVIKTGGKQYVVKAGDKLWIEKLPVEKGKKVSFDQVLLTADDQNELNIGKPFLDKVTVEATLVRNFKDKKVRVIKYKAKTRYKRVIGHRQQKSEVKIDKIIA